MKKWTYVFGALFTALLVGATIIKTRRWAMPDYVVYLFVALAGIFFFLLIFEAFKRPESKP